jgi:hypothetical protein
MSSRIFLLSPAHCGGRRAGILMRDGSTLPIARSLHEGTLTIGDAFSFMSGLYFRGKLAYARAFARNGVGDVDPILVITPTRGLMPTETVVSMALLQEFAGVDIADGGSQYLDPLERDLGQLAGRLRRDELVVLLGSVATGKYADILTKWLGDRLRYPAPFVGRGDMSRGGLLLRSAAANEELEYAVLRAGVRPRGPRPPKLTPL